MGMATRQQKQISHLKDLTPDLRNARKHTPRNVGMIEKALHEVGAARSIVVDEDGVILAGNATIEAAAAAGIEKVQVVDADGETIIAVRRSGLTPEQKRKLALFDNRTAELAEWDADMLGALAKEVDLSSMWTGEELQALLTEQNGQEMPEDPGPQLDKAEELRKKWQTETGQLWSLGSHRLLVGDATKREDVERVMGGEKADALVTDPPYGMNLDTDWSGIRGTFQSLGFKKAIRGKAYPRVEGDDAPFDPAPILALWAINVSEVFLFGADYYAERIPDRADGSWLVWDKRKESQSDGFGSEFELIWSRNKHKRRMLRHEWFGFLREGEHGESRTHPTQKPVLLIEDIISQWCNGVIIADPFLGSGTTMVAAHRLGRRCFGIEIDPGYCGVILERMSGLELTPTLITHAT